MGQKFGKAHFNGASAPFVNLSGRAMEALWEAFNNTAEGFGVNQEEFIEIMSELTEEMQTPYEKLKKRAEELFAAMDTDANNLVDALEFLSSLALSSGMNDRETLSYIFNCYDFDESGELTLDEMTLAMKSTLVGLCKMTDQKAPSEGDLEEISLHAFTESDKDGDCKISLVEFLGYMQRESEPRSWMGHFADSEELFTGLQPDVEKTGYFELVDAIRAGFPERDMTHASRKIGNGGMFTTLDDMFVLNEVAESAKEDEEPLPWRKTVLHMIPSEAPEGDKSLPDDTLSLEWVHGYQSNACRNNVYYTRTGDVAFHAANVGVVYSDLDRSQRFANHHDDMISAFTLHPSGTLAASACVGSVPKIVVWDTTTMESIATISGFHKDGVVSLAFSEDGKILASVGVDKYHSVALYEWETDTTAPLYTSICGERKALDCKFATSPSVFAICGDGFVNFFEKETDTYVKKRGLFGRIGKIQPITCLATSGPHMISGTASGALYIWEGRNCRKVVKAHTGVITSLSSSPHGLVSGGDDCKIRLWSKSMEAGAVFDISSFGHLPRIRSACQSNDGNRLLVGTYGSEIYEIASSDGSDLHHGPLIAGHCSGQLWGLAIHPSKPEFCTVGDDMTVRVWDLPTRKLIRMTNIDTPARAVAYAPNGEKILIGLGDDVKTVKKTKTGAFIVMNEADLTIIHETRDSKKWITDVKFSPNGSIIAVASSDHCVYFYDASDYSVKGKCNNHSAPVKRIDFSEDSDFVRSCCDKGELLFWRTENAQQEKSAPAMKDIAWATTSCSVGYQVQAVWPEGESDANVLCTAKSDTSFLATADKYGKVKMFRYPAVEAGQPFHEFHGHSSLVTNVKFANEDSHLLSLGGEDRCIFQWKVNNDGEKEDAEAIEVNVDEEPILIDGEEMDRSIAIENVLTSTLTVKPEVEKAENEGEVTIRPWYNNVVGPSTLPPMSTSAPDDTLELEWVHGYNGQTAHNNVTYAANGEIVFSCACVGVVLNVSNWTQQFFMVRRLYTFESIYI
jgi:WD40 repeat protein/Ca2+-binding EF-hand superfamily protein